MKPYYEHAGITIYHGDCLEVLWTHLNANASDFDLVLTDPPYGIDLNTSYAKTRHAARSKRLSSGCKKTWYEKDHPKIHGDATPFNPGPFLGIKHVAMFGANNFASRLPDSYSWLV